MKTNPFSAFGDFTPGNFDLSKFDFNKMLGNVKIPAADLEALVAGQRKNIEALTEANRVAVSGMQAMAKRQAEILSEAMATATTAVQEISAIADPRERLAKQTDVTKAAFEKALTTMRELAQAVSASADQVIGVVSKRVIEGLDEVKNLAPKK